MSNCVLEIELEGSTEDAAHFREMYDFEILKDKVDAPRDRRLRKIGKSGEHLILFCRQIWLINAPAIPAIKYLMYTNYEIRYIYRQ